MMVFISTKIWFYLLFCSFIVVGKLDKLIEFNVNENTPNSTLLNVKNNNEFRFASYYQDHMVLQHYPHSAVIWGYGKLDANISIVLDNYDYSTNVVSGFQNKSIWKVILKPHKAGGPHSIKAFQSLDNGENTSMILQDIYFGEVWLCSGQSNMQMSLIVIFNSSYELNQTVLFPYVRVFGVDRIIEQTEQFDFQKIGMNWSVPNPDNMVYFSAVCWLYGKFLFNVLKIPIGLIHSSWGGTPIETWSSERALHSCGLDHSKEKPLPNPNPQNNSLLWNSMIHPLLNMTIKGVVWYQGEQNTLYHKQYYNCSFPAMISDWREQWHKGTYGCSDQAFPFGFVQLGVLNEPDWVDDGTYPMIRWHQTADYGFVSNLKMPNTFMAVTIDLLDTGIPYGSPHYRDKQDVSYRLALGSAHHVYNFSNIVSEGPYPISTYFASVNTLIVQYSSDQIIFVPSNTQSFQVCCLPDKCGKYDLFTASSWTNSTAKHWSAHSISLDVSACVLGISAVRYAWSVTPCTFKQCQVYNIEGLPAAPFWIEIA